MSTAGDRHDYGKPTQNRFGVPGVNYPTPNVADLIIVEDIDITTGNYTPLLRGTPHPTQPAKLVSETVQPGDNNKRRVRRIYATDRAAQDAYNDSRKFVSESATHPVYIRSYIEPKPAVPLTRNLPLTSITDLVLTAGGSGYTAKPTVSFTGGGGSGAAADVVVQNGVVAAIWITAGGTGYTSAPTVAITGVGTGATATAQIQPAAAVLTHEEISGAPGELGSIYDQVVRVYTTQPGPVIHDRSAYIENTFWDTTRQAVAPGTLPTQPSGVVTEEGVRQLSTTEAEKVTKQLVKADGTPADGFPIRTTSRRDPRTGVQVYTDSFLASKTYQLPATFVGGDAASIASSYPDWKQPNSGNIGYGSTSYSPKRYVWDARKRAAGDNNDLVVVEIDYAAIPSSRVDDSREEGFTFPALFDFDQTAYSVPANYGGQYRPPWPIGADKVGGYARVAHRPGKWPARRLFLYTLGRNETLPEVYAVTTPGTASKFFQIPERCIHPPIQVTEQLTNGSYQTIEDIPASTPSSYNKTDILVASATCRRFEGEIYETEIVYVSEATPLSKFPDPADNSYSFATAPFTVTAATSLSGASSSGSVALNGRRIVATTTGGASASVILFGKERAGIAAVNARETLTISAGGPNASTTSFLSLREVLVSPPLASDSVIIKEAVSPSTGSIEFLSQPADKDVVYLGITGSDERIYQFRTALTSDAVTSITITSPGSGYIVAPALSIANTGTSPAYASAVVSGGVVVSALMGYPGSGYSTGALPAVTFSDGGTAATATASMSGTAVTTIAVGTAGTGYGTSPTVVFTPTSGGQGAKAIASVSGGAITGIALKTATVTAISTATDTFTSVGHGLSNGDGLKFSTTSVLPSPLVAGTIYYVINSATDTFKVSATSGGSAVDITTAGSGTLTITYSGGGYITAPTISFTGGKGSGAAATAVVSQANQVLIGATVTATAGNFMYAVKGQRLGESVGSGTVAHADLTATRSASLLRLVNLYTLSPTSNTLPTLGATTGVPFVDQHDSTWPSVTSFVTGGEQQTLCTIPALATAAFQRAFLNGNAALLDETNDNDRLAAPNLPAAPVIYTDWLTIPEATAITLRYSVAGTPPVRVAYQKANSTTEPTPTTVSVSVTNSSTAISGAGLGSYVGCKIVIPGDTVENELTSSTTLLRAYTGTTGTKSSAITNLVATVLLGAGNAYARTSSLGVPGTTYIRLKLTQTSPYQFRAIQATASWPIIP